MPSLFRRQRGGRRGRARWEDKGPTPLGERGYTPQGLTWAEGRLVFANSWKNTRSRVYQFNPQSMQVLGGFDMPAEAVHTSGLAWDGRRLWAVDYISNRGYCLDLAASLAAGRACLAGQFETGMRGTSACCMVPWNGCACLAISDYMRTRRTVFVRPDDAVASGTILPHVVFSYRNEGFSQGLECFGGFLYEAENKAGTDVVNKICLERLARTADSRRATVMQYPAPARGVEDLAWDGQSLWTSDETLFRFYRGILDSP